MGTQLIMAPKPRHIDEYLAGVSEDKRAALQSLRKAIKTAVPGVEECISSQLPAFRLRGKLLVAFGAGKSHCSFYPGAYPIAAHKQELKSYATSKGTIRFSSDEPLPVALVRKLIKSRIKERHSD